MGRKSDIVQQCDDIEQGRVGTEEETMTVGLTQILLGQKIKKIHTVDSADTNGW
jgi:hypothetical protein